jgi:hypothetical protein
VRLLTRFERDPYAATASCASESSWPSTIGTVDTYLALIQTAAVVAAVAGLIVALRIAQDDRRESARLAREDRAVARREAERRHRLDLLIRLSVNREQGGSTDPAEANRLGAEAAALTSALGPTVVPQAWARRGSLDEAKERQKTTPPPERVWRHLADEVAIALDRVARGDLA